MNPNFMPVGALSAASSSLQQPLPDRSPAKKKKPSLFDDENRSKTLLTLGAALLSGNGQQNGLSAAAGALAQMNDKLTTKKKKLIELGGPDNTFEIHTDPETGEKTYTPIKELQAYKADAKDKPADRADRQARAMLGVSKLKTEEARRAAYQDILDFPGRYGVELDMLPSEYDEGFINFAAELGMNTSQTRTRDAFDNNSANQNRNRDERTGILKTSTEARIRQGDVRLGQGQQRIDKPSSKGGKGTGGNGLPAGYRIVNGVIMKPRKK
jgi:hypothetical protein